MKNKFLAAILFFLAIPAVCIFAQTDNPQYYKTDHYELYAENGAENGLPALGKELELRYDVYNKLFRFGALSSPLRVRVFIDPQQYDDYVQARLGTTRAGAVYLHYNQAERRELVVLQGSPETASMVAHQSFIQFLRGHISNPPSWMREGFAIYFNSIKFDPVTETLDYEENLAWLETLKGLGDKILHPREIMMRDTIVYSESAASSTTAGIYSRDFQICSWALVSFLLNSGDYFRTLTESFMVLSPTATAAENCSLAMDRFSSWADLDQMDTDFFTYIDSRKTFTELMDSGRYYYDAGNSMNAEMAFMSALDLRPTNYAPYYYLGLIYYDEKSYDMAEDYYKQSIEYGADEALVSYALGVNAASAGRSGDAVTWLQKAAELNPDRYKTRADDIIQRLSQ
ncbi:MAG: tetratricopeptide repeat protein [Treponema sp.]|nr:tetratricopeptide repeat protein [Treponema sp.]